MVQSHEQKSVFEGLIRIRTVYTLPNMTAKALKNFFFYQSQKAVDLETLYAALDAHSVLPVRSK